MSFFNVPFQFYVNYFSPIAEISIWLFFLLSILSFKPKKSITVIYVLFVADLVVSMFLNSHLNVHQLLYIKTPISGLIFTSFVIANFKIRMEELGGLLKYLAIGLILTAIVRVVIPPLAIYLETDLQRLQIVNFGTYLIPMSMLALIFQHLYKIRQ